MDRFHRVICGLRALVPALLPPHITGVEPADGETIGGDYRIWISFDLQAGAGRGADPEKAMKFLMDGEEPMSWAVGWDMD